jgi:signal transduction histidine kinase
MSLRLLRLLMVLVVCWSSGAAADTDAPGVQELTAARAVIVPEHSEARVREVTLPFHLDRELGTRSGEASFEVPFALPEVPDEPYGVYFARIGNTAEIWLNGTLVARLGELTGVNRDDYSKGPQYVPIAQTLLRKDNRFVIRLRADGGRRAGLSAMLVGPATATRGAYLNAFRWRMVGSLAVAVFSVIIGLTALVLWFTQTDETDPARPARDRLYLAAAVAELCWALRVGDIAIEQPPLPWPAWGVVVTAAFAGWICCTALFCHRVARWHRHPAGVWFNTWLGALFAGSILASTLAFTLHKPIFLTLWLATANVFFAGYAAVYFVAALRKREAAPLLVATAGVVNVAVGVRDWVAIRISGSYDESTWIRYSSVLFGMVLGYIVITRFRRASAQAHDLMTNLAVRVAEKELQLQQTYDQLEHLARGQERAAERTRILRDLHDGVGSHISAAIRQLQSGKASRDDVLQTLRDSLDQLKLSIDAMNVPPGDITALLANLRYRLEPRFAASDVELQWNVDLLNPLARLDANGMRQLQFMVFEALSNVLQHAHASVLRIEASARGAGARLRIVDNGQGFDVQAPLRKGLVSMRERAAMIGAVLTLASEPGRTVVEIILD